MPILEIQDLCHVYGERKALIDINLCIEKPCCFAILGPNGSGKTTLFHILSSLLLPASGKALLCGKDVVRQGDEIRKILGVVFQSPGLDAQLTVRENLLHHGHIYGLWGKNLHQRIGEVMEQFSVADRADELVKKLSGGLQRRVDLARSLLHHPQILLLDEPTTGLDPNARRDFWDLIAQIRTSHNTTIIFTTHLFAEAELSDTLAIFDSGHLVSCGSPGELKSQLGGNILLVQPACGDLLNRIKDQFVVDASIVADNIRIENHNGKTVLTDLLAHFSDEIESLTWSKPTLEDLFVHKTGKRFMVKSA